MAVQDIIISPARIYKAPIGESLPNVNTVAYGAAWGGNWVDLGRTLQGVVVRFDKEKFTLQTEQDILPVREVVTSFKAGFDAVLAEMTGANLVLALDASKTTTAPGVGAVGHDVVSVDGTKAEVSSYAFGVEGFRLTNANLKLPVRIFFKKASISVNGEVNLAKGAGAGLSVTITALAEDSGIPIVIHNVTAPAT